MKPYVKEAASFAAKTALGLCLGYILGPIIGRFVMGSGISGHLIAQKLVIGIAFFPVLFVGIWMWGMYARKH